MKSKVCCKRGCMRTALPGTDYCSQHIALSAQPRPIFTHRGKSAAYNYMYRTARWRKERAEFLAQYPLCFICGRPATIVDHIRPHKGDVNLFWDRNNWQPMCQRCHSAKTLRENNNFHTQG